MACALTVLRLNPSARRVTNAFFHFVLRHTPSLMSIIRWRGTRDVMFVRHWTIVFPSECNRSNNAMISFPVCESRFRSDHQCEGIVAACFTKARGDGHELALSAAKVVGLVPMRDPCRLDGQRGLGKCVRSSDGMPA